MKNIIAITLFIAGTFVFGMAYHNIDLSVNAKAGSIDVNGFGYVQSIEQMYMNGMSALTVSAVFMISGFILLFPSGEIRPLIVPKSRRGEYRKSRQLFTIPKKLRR